MYEQDAIDVDDFVFAATGARVRRLTLPQGEHWFPAADVARSLGYANTRQALQMHVAARWQKRLSELAGSVCTADTLRKVAGHRLQKSMKMVNLEGLVQLVNGCTKPECEPFEAWVAEVVATIQRDGCHELEPAPVQPAPTVVSPMSCLSRSPMLLCGWRSGTFGRTRSSRRGWRRGTSCWRSAMR